MEGRAIDAGEFRAAQRSSWDSAASGWEFGVGVVARRGYRTGRLQLTRR